jgi:DNA-binding GntR family transcriptional regulator
MTIEPGGPEPMYIQLARILRDEIIAGQIPLGGRLPGELSLTERYQISRETVRDAFRQLREEGLVRTRSGQGSFVVAVPQQQVIELRAGDLVRARMPGEAERARLGLPPGVPVLVITRAGGQQEIRGAAAAMCRCTADGDLLPA